MLHQIEYPVFILRMFQSKISVYTSGGKFRLVAAFRLTVISYYFFYKIESN